MRRPGLALLLVYGCICIPYTCAQTARQDRPILDAGDKAGIAIGALTFAALVVAAVWGYLKWRNYRAVQHPYKASSAGVAQLPSTHQDIHKHWQRRDASGKAAAGMQQLVGVHAHHGDQAATAAAVATPSHSSLSFVGRAVHPPAAPCAAAGAAAAANNRDTFMLAPSLSGSTAEDAHYPSPLAGSVALSPQHNSMATASSAAGSDIVAPVQQQHSVGRQTTARSPSAAGSSSARHDLHSKPSLLKQQSTAMFVGFTRDECMVALTSLGVSVSKLVHGSIRPTGDLAAAKPWLLKGLDSAKLLIDEHRHGHQLDVHWGKSKVLQWLHSNLWTQEDHSLIADMLASATAAATAGAYASGTDVTDADIARQLLIEVRKNPMQEGYRAAVAGFTNQMMGQMTAAAGQISQLDTSASRRAAVAVVEAALLFMLQVMGTSEGMQIFVPALRGDATGSPPDAVEFDDKGVVTGSPCYVLCTKPGVLAIEAGSQRIVAIQPAQATRYAHSNSAGSSSWSTSVTGPAPTAGAQEDILKSF